MKYENAINGFTDMGHCVMTWKVLQNDVQYGGDTVLISFH